MNNVTISSRSFPSENPNCRNSPCVTSRFSEVPAFHKRIWPREIVSIRDFIFVIADSVRCTCFRPLEHFAFTRKTNRRVHYNSKQIIRNNILRACLSIDANELSLQTRIHFIALACHADLHILIQECLRFRIAFLVEPNARETCKEHNRADAHVSEHRGTPLFSSCRRSTSVRNLWLNVFADLTWSVFRFSRAESKQTTQCKKGMTLFFWIPREDQSMDVQN